MYELTEEQEDQYRSQERNRQRELIEKIRSNAQKHYDQNEENYQSAGSPGSYRAMNAVRKKGFELYDVPMTEYLDISDSIKKELGYTTGRIALAMASYRPKAVKYYLHPMGDVNMNGDVDIADAQLALQKYCNVVVAKGAGVLSEEQRKLADVVPRQYWNDDNEALMMDAQTILMYYAESLVDLNILNISMDEWAETYYRDMVLD